MKILLAVTVSEERFHVIPDIGIGYLAALARNQGHEVKYIDCLLEHYTYDDWEQAVREYKPDLVGVKAYSLNVEQTQVMLDRVKAVSPEIRTVIGGPHPSTDSPEVLMEQFGSLDYALAGEAEPGWVKLLSRLEAGRDDFEDVEGLVWRAPDGSVKSNEKVLVSEEELNKLPFPAWDLIDPRRYPHGFSFLTARTPAAPMILTRGCPYRCTFCGSYLITGRKVRKRNLDNVIEEIRLLQKDYGVRSIDLCDENFVLKRDYVMEFCERLLSENIKIHWSCPYGVRLDRLDEELVRTMARAGCFGFAVGVESGSNRILKQIKKVLTVEQTIEQVHMIKRVSNIRLQGFFMMGFPSETKEEVEATINLACSLPFDVVAFFPLRVTPGTEIFADLLKSGVIQPNRGYGSAAEDYVTGDVSAIPLDELQRLYRKAYMKFYLRPHVLFNVLFKSHSASQVRSIVNGLGRLLSRPVARLDPTKRHLRGKGRQRKTVHSSR